jgi:hypothetical protein
MQSSQQNALSKYRRSLKRQGIVRVEVQVRKSDAGLVRKVARALADPDRENEIRSLLKDQVEPPSTRGFKAFLASAPLEGVELERPRDLGRDVAF